MVIGLLKEIKSSEHRVLLAPNAVQHLVDAGHEVLVENGAGLFSNFEDSAYESAGAKILPISEKIYKNAQFILKVQPPMPIEYELFTPDHLGFSFLFLANNKERFNALLACASTFIAAEMIKDNSTVYPILKSMSEIGGMMAIQQAAKLLEKPAGGKGIFISGTKDVSPGRVTIIGAGNAGSSAAKHALRMGATVNLMDEQYTKLIKFQTENISPNLYLFEYSRGIMREILLETDVLITCAQISGQRAPILVKKEDVKVLEPGSIIIDLSIDQGGNVETSRPTTHENPTFIRDDIVHCCVANLPSAVPNTASRALSTVALPYVKLIAQIGCEEALALNSEIRNGLNIYRGKVVNPDLAKLHNLENYDVLELLELNI
jgi:alanine dehydrogenase